MDAASIGSTLRNTATCTRVIFDVHDRIRMNARSIGMVAGNIGSAKMRSLVLCRRHLGMPAQRSAHVPLGLWVGVTVGLERLSLALVPRFAVRVVLWLER